MKKQTKIIIAVVAIVAVIAILCGVYVANKPATTQGSKSVTLEVIDNEGNSTMYEANTDAEYLSELFEEIDGLTVEGSTSEYGLYIETVNGVTADYSVDSSYWSIMVNGEYGMYGADSQPVTDGDAYQLVYTTYEAN